VTSLRTWRIVLPYQRPPLLMNDVRGKAAHWSRQRDAKANVGEAVGYLARQAKVDPVRVVAVTLVQVPPDRIVRDADGLGWMMKAALDGLVDAGCLRGDDSRYVRRTTCEIAPRAVRPGSLYLTIDELPEDR
jgi:hypothetical protein